MQTILGSGGAIGVELAKALTEYTEQIRLVSRNPKKVNATDELLQADLLNPEEMKKAVKGSSVVYVTIGFPYSYKVWSKHWMPFIQSVVDACIEFNSKLVFFDNIYMYDKYHLDGMTEETPVNPPSKKGEVRKTVADIIMDAVKLGKLTALIARSADFYGPGIENSSILTEMVLKPFSEGKTASWMGSIDFKHSFTYTPDAGKATAILGNSEKAWNQVWHLPTAGNPPTGKEWITLCAKELGTKPKYRVVSKTMLKLIGWFVPIMSEMPEMIYQYDRDYVFDSQKFEKEFSFSPTPYPEGIKQIIQNDYAK